LQPLKVISRSIWILALVSMLTDMASEMLYPVLPVYLKQIGFSVLLIGLLEGLAEATAGLSKGYFGKMSDLSGKRLPFVRIGYALSGISRPMMAMFVWPLWIFMSRTLDRFGKGIRTGARDAMLSDESTPATKGRVFGFHRSMDTLGAVLGPGIALIYLYYHPEDYRTLFFIAFIPGILAVLATYLLKEQKRLPRTEPQRNGFFSFLSYWKTAPKQYRQLLIGLLAFALFNSSDVFLLLKAREAGVSDTAVIGLYMFYNLVYAIAAYPLGILADRIGLKRIYIAGLLMFALVYAGMSQATSLPIIAALFLVYGLFSAATEGISKAWITNISAREDSATAIGTYTGFQSICSLLASSITGFVWFQFGGMAAFIGTALVTLCVAFYLLRMPEEVTPEA